MKCPHCNKDRPLRDQVMGHVERYVRKVHASCVHCAGPIAVKPRLTVILHPIPEDPGSLVDDWGYDYNYAKKRSKQPAAGSEPL